MFQLGGIGTVGVVVFLGLSAYAAFSDIARYRIANWISLAILADFIVVAVYASVMGSLEPMMIVWSLGVGITMLIAGLALFAAGVFGGGDAKLLAASAVWFGWSGLYRYILLVALLGGLLALVVLGLRRFAPKLLQHDPQSGQTWLSNLLSGDHGIPYGVALAVASWLMFCPFIISAEL